MILNRPLYDECERYMEYVGWINTDSQWVPPSYYSDCYDQEDDLTIGVWYGEEDDLSVCIALQQGGAYWESTLITNITCLDLAKQVINSYVSISEEWKLQASELRYHEETADDLYIALKEKEQDQLSTKDSNSLLSWIETAKRSVPVELAYSFAQTLCSTTEHNENLRADSEVRKWPVAMSEALFHADALGWLIKQETVFLSLEDRVLSIVSNIKLLVFAAESIRLEANTEHEYAPSNTLNGVSNYSPIDLYREVALAPPLPPTNHHILSLIRGVRSSKKS